MNEDNGASLRDRAVVNGAASVSALRDGIPDADWAGTDFARGAQACREMMARFVEQGGDAVFANSIRCNWHPGWGDDPGAPPYIIDTWEPPECPEGEADYARFCAEVANDPDHAPDTSPEGLDQTAKMLETWAIPMLPANRHGQVPFLRAMIECAVRDLRLAAQGMAAPSGGETGTGSTEGNSPVGKADAPKPTQEDHHGR